MADHAFFIWICDYTRFQPSHGRECFFDSWLHFLEKIVRKFHPADVDGKIEIVIANKIVLEPLPE